MKVWPQRFTVFFSSWRVGGYCLQSTLALFIVRYAAIFPCFQTKCLPRETNKESWLESKVELKLMWFAAICSWSYSQTFGLFMPMKSGLTKSSHVYGPMCRRATLFRVCRVRFSLRDTFLISSKKSFFPHQWVLVMQQKPERQLEIVAAWAALWLFWLCDLAEPGRWGGGGSTFSLQ